MRGAGTEGERGTACKGGRDRVGVDQSWRGGDRGREKVSL